jgi:hypothetical protein
MNQGALSALIHGRGVRLYVLNHAAEDLAERGAK